MHTNDDTLIHEASQRPAERDDPARTPRRPWSLRTRRIVKVVASLVGVLALVGLVGGFWVLDRFVIAHVEIADVDAYAASVNATSTTTIAPGDTSAGVVTEDPVDTTATSVEPVITGSTYTADGVSVTVDEVTIGSGADQIVYFVADIVLDDATDLLSAFAKNAFGTNIVEYTSDIAEDNDAVLAINGDYYGFRDTGIVIRNGIAYRDEGARMGLAIYRDGTMAVYDETTTTAQELIEAGVWNTLSFGPALVDDGAIVDGIENVEVDRYIGKHSIQGAQPRTGVGMIEPNHFLFIVVDGRSTGYSRGMTMTEFAELFQSLGATVAYNLDGGGSATMYFNGEVINDPLGRGNERGTSDILYIG